MKKLRGIVLLLAVLSALAYATVAQAGCYKDAAGNIVWCTDSVDPVTK